MYKITIYPTIGENQLQTSKIYLARRSKFFSLPSAIKILITVLIFTFAGSQMFGQTPPVELQENRLIGELPGHVDVKFRVVKCESSNVNQVILYLHNESERYNNPNDVDSVFDIVILDYANKKSFTQNITISIKTGEVITADCESDSPLKIDLPASYNPSTMAAYLKPTNN